MIRVVLDTSVLVAAARSRRGASAALLGMLPWINYQPALSVPLYLEWLAVLTRPDNLCGREVKEVLEFLRYLAEISWAQPIYFRWRPGLPDADDDFILELASAAQAKYIVTHNLADFEPVRKFGIEPIQPKTFLNLLRDSSRS